MEDDPQIQNRQGSFRRDSVRAPGRFPQWYTAAGFHQKLTNLPLHRPDDVPPDPPTLHDAE